MLFGWRSKIILARFLKELQANNFCAIGGTSRSAQLLLINSFKMTKVLTYLFCLFKLTYTAPGSMANHKYVFSSSVSRLWLFNTTSSIPMPSTSCYLMFCHIIMIWKYLTNTIPNNTLLESYRICCTDGNSEMILLSSSYDFQTCYSFATLMWWFFLYHNYFVIQSNAIII